MSDNVINLDDYRPRIRGDAVCMECRHEWEMVAEVGVTFFDCPECGLSKGAFAGAVTRDEPAWHCSCGNYLFLFHLSGIICARCGLPQQPHD